MDNSINEKRYLDWFVSTIKDLSIGIIVLPFLPFMTIYLIGKDVSPFNNLITYFIFGTLFVPFIPLWFLTYVGSKIGQYEK